MRARLLVKASLSAVSAIVAQRLPTARIERAVEMDSGRQTLVMVVSEDSRLHRMVTDWCIAPEHRELIDGYGYPHGALLYYRYYET